MSGEVTQRSSQKFEIEIENFDHAINAILSIDASKLDFSFPDLSGIKKDQSYALEKIFKEFNIEVLCYDGGGVGELHFKSEKYGSRHKVLFETLAPFVVNGSFLEFEATYEDTAIWRLIFHHGQVLHVNADISYKMPEETEKEFKGLKILVQNIPAGDVRSSLFVVAEILELSNPRWNLIERLDCHETGESDPRGMTLEVHVGDKIMSQESLDYTLEMISQRIVSDTRYGFTVSYSGGD